jgi:hypothetical protein
MGVDIVMYRATVCIFCRRKDKVVLSSEFLDMVGSVNMWFFGLIAATLLIVGGVD